MFIQAETPAHHYQHSLHRHSVRHRSIFSPWHRLSCVFIVNAFSPSSISQSAREVSQVRSVLDGQPEQQEIEYGYCALTHAGMTGLHIRCTLDAANYLHKTAMRTPLDGQTSLCGEHAQSVVGMARQTLAKR